MVSSNKAESVAPGWQERRLGLGAASAVVVANMVGAGVFTTSGFALADLGSPGRVLLAWVLGGGIALCGALSYAGIARRIPLSGGEATYLGRAFHPVLGFMAGWVSILAGFTGPIAAAALAFGEYAGTAFGAAWPPAWPATIVIVLAAAMHALRPGAGTSSLNALVVAKLVGLGCFALWALPRIVAAPGEAPSEAPPLEWGAFATTLVWVSFSYTGWNGAVYLAEEIRDPERNLSRALWLPTIGVAVVYVGLNAIFLWAPGAELVGRPDVAAAAAEALGGAAAARAVAAIVSIALLTSVSVMVLSGSRVLARLARDGLLPSALARGGRRAPLAAIAFQALAAVAIVWASNLAQLIATLGFTLGLSSALTVGAALWLRRREGAAAVPIVGYPVTPLLFIGFTLWGAAFLVLRSPADAALGVALLLAGLPAYALARWRARGR